VWVIRWRIRFSADTLGLASFMAFMEGFYFACRNKVFLRVFTARAKVFSMSLGVGVVPCGVASDLARPEPNGLRGWLGGGSARGSSVPGQTGRGVRRPSDQWRRGTSGEQLPSVHLPGTGVEDSW